MIATGEQARTYVFPQTGEEIPYQLYVPTTWRPGMRLPLIVATHGAGQPATAPFQRPTANPTLAKMAEERGYLVAAVTGYRANATLVGGWNVPYAMVPAARATAAQAARAQPPATEEDFRRAEADVLFVTEIVSAEYGVDPARVYLMGNSAGGSAVWTYATRHTQWAAVSPSAAPLVDDTFPYEALKDVPVLVVHGDADTTMDFEASRRMVEHARAKGVDATWLPVPGGQHIDAWAQPEILKQIFDFFDAHPKRR